jgi:hypothetical protein
VPDGRLSISITHADGRVTRLGPDEVKPENVPTGLGFSTAMPGGYGTCSLQLLQRIDLETPLQLFDDVTVYGPGGETAFQGYITQLPRSHGDSYGLTPGAVGYSATLKDRPDFAMVYVDQDPNSWTDVTLERRERKLATLGTPLNTDYTPSVGVGSVTFQGVGGKSIISGSSGEVMYVTPAGVNIARLTYRGVEANTSNVAAATLGTSDSLDLNPVTATALTLDNVLRSTVGLTPTRYASLSSSASGTHTPAAGSEHRRTFKTLAVYGDHGLTTHATSGPDGVYASDVIAHILDTVAPDLTYTTGADGSITPSSFAIPHLVFREPVTADDAILFVNAYHQYEWAVWEDRTFYWGPTDPDRVCWEARLSEGAHLSLEGQQSADTVNGVFVTYTDPTGQRKTVGPPGATADATDTTLADTSDANPLNQRGRIKWARMDISQVTTAEGAVQLGAIWLAEQAIPQRRGTVTVRGCIEHPTRGKRPTWAVRAGDYVRIADHPTDVPRRIISTDYRHDEREVQMDVGTSSQKLTAILERLNVASIGRY